MNAIRGLALGGLLLALVGCATQPSPLPSGSSAPSSPAASPSAPATSGSPAPSAPGDPVPSPSAESPGAAQLAQDSVARVVTNDLRVRSKPEVSDASIKLNPLLAAPRLVFIVDGPVEGSGYTWYEVAPIGDKDVTVELPFGWVAAADKDGTPWIEAVTPQCPTPPTTVDALWTLDTVLGLACFGETPITIDAQLMQPEATCGVDLGWTIEPGWLASTCPQATFLVESRTNPELSFLSIIDPKVNTSAFKPGVDPEDAIPVRVTGRFDHPAATDCRGVSDSQPVPYGPSRIVLTCRATFVITAIAAD